ncbi:hypothetical protein ACI3ET_04830 [Ornithinimicrobium sp. LYQ121]|uniref:hypothetical protein n=1 Tax=Ornithinimicrobium sp. LYQ121 TaxID=3378801 RepID=UPI0038520A75
MGGTMVGVEEQRVATVDLAVRIEFCHAALQHLADQLGVDLLHIKGIAFEPQWRSRASGGSDADVLVRPSQVKRFVEALEARGWRRRSRFHTGSPFGHAQTYWHDHLGYADIHRFFPGMQPGDKTFDTLWSDRLEIRLASVPCPVPDQAGQALVHLLNEARNGMTVRRKEGVVELLGAELTAQVEALVGRVGAEVGYAAALGELDRVGDHREHDLWHVVVTRSGRVEEWRARVKAQSTLTAKALTVLRAPLVNTEHLANTRGHPPSVGEVVVEFGDRVRRGVTEIWRSRRRGRA